MFVLRDEVTCLRSRSLIVTMTTACRTPISFSTTSVPSFLRVEVKRAFSEPSSHSFDRNVVSNVKWQPCEIELLIAGYGVS